MALLLFANFFADRWLNFKTITLFHIHIIFLKRSNAKTHTLKHKTPPTLKLKLSDDQKFSPICHPKTE